MSEQNILNPSVASTLNPDYPINIQDPQTNARWQARSGKPFMRRLAAQGRMHSLSWTNRLTSDYAALMQWFAQYENDFFSYVDWERGRYFTGMFADQPQYSRNANNQVTVQAQFIELPTLPMFQYPSNWGVDSIFLNIRNGFGNDLVKLTGAGWVLQNPQGLAHGGMCYTDATTNDFGEWLYFGYGFRLWIFKAPSRGIGEVSLDNTVLGTIDQYAAANTGSAPLWTQQNVSLGVHRVKYRVTGTKNAASSAFNIDLDAIEVMR